MKLQLPNSISSRQDLTALMLDVKEYARWYSHVSVKKRVSAQQPAEPPVLAPASVELLNAWNAGHPIDTKSLDDLISALEEFGAAAPTLTITLAAPATNDLKKTLVTWCRTNIAPDMLITFRFNSTLLGGMVIRYGSHIYDWSFRREILTKRAHFAEVLRRV